MYLVNYLNKLIKEDGFILLDANSNNYVIGNPKKQNPIKDNNGSLKNNHIKI